MFVFIEKSIQGCNKSHLSLVPETARDRKLLQRLIDSHDLVGSGMDPETKKPTHVSIALEASND